MDWECDLWECDLTQGRTCDDHSHPWECPEYREERARQMELEDDYYGVMALVEQETPVSLAPGRQIVWVVHQGRITLHHRSYASPRPFSLPPGGFPEQAERLTANHGIVSIWGRAGTQHKEERRIRRRWGVGASAVVAAIRNLWNDASALWIEYDDPYCVSELHPDYESLRPAVLEALDLLRMAKADAIGLMALRSALLRLCRVVREVLDPGHCDGQRRLSPTGPAPPTPPPARQPISPHAPPASMAAPSSAAVLALAA